jgi:putative membrane protein
MLQDLKINHRAFVLYKLFNSLFLGVSVGSIFTIYTPLEPSVYSVGGIVLAIAMIFIAKQYHKILNATYFYRISLLVEWVVLALVIGFLIFSYSYQTALWVYIGYQLTFVFGSYLVRAETLVLKEDEILTKVDIAKQYGYLIGMAASYSFYKLLEYGWEITDHQEQVYLLHFILLAVELVVIGLLVRAFRK